MFTDFDYLIESLDMEALEIVLAMPLNEHDKRIALGYVIAKPLKGVQIAFPRKAHSTSYAKLLISHGIEIDEISETLEITTKTLKKYKVAANG